MNNWGELNEINNRRISAFINVVYVSHNCYSLPLVTKHGVKSDRLNDVWIKMDEKLTSLYLFND